MKDPSILNELENYKVETIQLEDKNYTITIGKKNLNSSLTRIHVKITLGSMINQKLQH